MTLYEKSPLGKKKKKKRAEIFYDKVLYILWNIISQNFPKVEKNPYLESIISQLRCLGEMGSSKAPIIPSIILGRVWIKLCSKQGGCGSTFLPIS